LPDNRIYDRRVGRHPGAVVTASARQLISSVRSINIKIVRSWGQIGYIQSCITTEGINVTREHGICGSVTPGAWRIGNCQSGAGNGPIGQFKVSDPPKGQPTSVTVVTRVKVPKVVGILPNSGEAGFAGGSSGPKGHIDQG